MVHEDVRAYYQQFGEREWQRLERVDEGRIEFIVTCHALTTYLPKTGRILDIGGGPGRYTLWLAEQGYQVVLADLSPELVRIAQEKVAASPVADQVEDITVADICDLTSWEDQAFDAVLALGPFYHLTEEAERRQAARELTRVLRSQAPAFVALMPRYAFLRRTLAIEHERQHLTSPVFVHQVLEQGVFQNDRPGSFTNGYGVRPEEVAPFFARYGLTQATLLAAQGIVTSLQPELTSLSETDPQAYAAMLDIIIRTAGDPSILGMANHLLYVGHKA